MTRKFNRGRQGEQLMSTDVFRAYNRIKYIGNGIDVPKQEYQTPILDYSCWIDRGTGHDVVKVFNQITQAWNPAFQGYYHPACVTEQPSNPVDGQLWLDSNYVLKVYEDKQWKVVHAAPASELSNVAAGISNFLLMPDLEPITGSDRDYLVPLITTGKLFDNKKYVPTSNFTGNEIRLVYPLGDGDAPTEKVSWIHVNPSYLTGATKRLIKIIDPIKDKNWFIDTPVTNTEFYGFNNGEPNGTLLRYIQGNSGSIESNISAETTDSVSDYRKVSGGIQLINNGRNYDFIYAITYKFDTVKSNYGYVLRDNVTIGDNNEVFVGQIQGFPLVFLNGTYLEQDSFVYNSEEGTLSFSGADITNEMDLVVAALADVVRYSLVEYPNTELEQRPPFELEITSQDIDENGAIVRQHDYIKQASTFKHPIAFVHGLATMYDAEYGIIDNIDLDTSAGIIKVPDFGPINPGDSVSILIADIGDAKLSCGIAKDDYIEDENIEGDKKYLLFIEGLCISPSDQEQILNGRIDVPGLVAGQRYCLMSLDKGQNGIDLMFDAPVSYYTVQINDNNASAVYNDCSMVMSYVYNDDGTYNGILLDQNALTSSIGTDRAYSTGEILKTRRDLGDGLFAYEYKIFNVHGDLSWTKYVDEYGASDDLKLTNMITQFNGNGSISIMSNEKLKGKNLEYYAYTYCDEVDEPILSGKNTIRKAILGHKNDANIPQVQDFYVSRTHIYNPPNKGCLAAYENGIQVCSTDSESVECKFTIEGCEASNYIKSWGTEADLYPLLKEITEETTINDLLAWKEDKYKNQLKDYSINENLLDKFKILSEVIDETENNNELLYYVERVEAGESYSVNRNWLNSSNRFASFDNTFTSPSYIGPGAINVYLNGVMLDKTSYSIFDNHNVILNDLQIAGGSDEFDTNKEETHRLIKYYAEVFDPETNKMKGETKKVYCESPDEVMIEYRPDVNIRKASYELKESTYSDGVLYDYEYDFPDGLLNSKDIIKIYIDGILYTGGYQIKGKNIVLLNSPLKEDPIKFYFDNNPDKYSEWKKINGEYTYTKSRIIFEWR